MEWQSTPYVFPLFVGAAAAFVAALFAWQRRPARAAVPLTLFLLLGGWWAFAAGIMLLNTQPDRIYFWSKAQWISVTMIPTLLLLFTLEYTRRDHLITRRNLALLLVEPLLILGLVLSNESHHLFWAETAVREVNNLMLFVPQRGLFFWVNTTYSYFLIGISLLLMYQAIRSSSGSYRRQAILLEIMFLIPLLANILVVSTLLSHLHIDLTPVSFSISGVGALWALFGFQLLDLVPVARNALVEHMNDAVLVLDRRQRVSDYNPAARRLMDLDQNALGQHVRKVCSFWGRLQEDAMLQTEGYGDLRLELNQNQHHFEVQLSPLQDRSGVIGTLVIFHDATRRKRAESNLRQQEKLHASLIEFSPDPLVLYDREGNATYVNQAFTETFGWTRDEVLGRPYDAFIPAGREEQTQAALRQIAEQGADTLDSQRLTKDGRVLDVQIKISLLRDEQGDINGSIVSLRDVSASKRTEAALRHQNEYLATLHETAVTLMQRLELDDLLENLVRRMTTLLDVPFAEVYLVNPDGRLLDFKLRVEEDEVLEFAKGPAQLRPNEGLAGQVWQRGEVIRLENYSTWEGRLQTPNTDNLRAAMGVPLELHGHVVGVITMVATDAQRRFGDEDLHLLMRFAQLATIAIDNAQLYTAAQQELYERKRVEEALRESENRYRTIIETIEDGYYEVDLRGNFTYFNEALANIMHRSRTELPQMNYRQVMDAANAEVVYKTFNHIYRTGEARMGVEYEIILPEGGIRNMESSVTLMRGSEGQPIGFRGIMRDITERRRAAEELARARDAAEAANRSKSTFLANMSHELRTPLNAIIGYTDLLLSGIYGTVTEKQIDRLHRVIENGQHLLGLINDVLDLSKIEAGKMEVYLESFDLAGLIDTIVGTVRPQMDANQNTLTLELPPQLGEMHTDATKLRQVLYNLLSNAAKFTQNGAIMLTVEVEQSDLGDWLTFQVRDTGIGMTESQLEHIFEEFAQADSSTTRKYGGTGLGLAISRRFCWLMGGDISVTSTVGEGSTFTVQLPRDAVASPLEVSLETGSLPPLAAPSTVNTVLVIDDDPTIRELMQHYLSKEGYYVVTAADGASGLQMARELYPAVITLDVMMPELDGWSVLSHLKSQPDLAHIPVIMLTMVSEHKRGYTLGASDYLTKPIQRDLLMKAISKFSCADPPCPVLIVEDDPETRRLMRDTLESAGWRVEEAANGRLGLEAVRENRPSLILLDLMMPEVDGFSFLEELRRHREWRLIPVIVTTAKDLTKDDRLRLNGYVQKIIQKGAYEQENLLREVRDLVRMYIPVQASPGE